MTKQKVQPAKGPYKNRLTADLLGKLTLTIRTGVSLEHSAESVGVPRSTFFDWLAKGRRPGAHHLYRKLAEAVDRSLAEFEVNAMARIEAAGAKGEWTADAWRLERKMPEEYGRRTRIEGQVQVQAVPFIDMSKLTVEQAHQLLYLLELAQPNKDQLQTGQAPALELLPGGGEAVG